MRFSDNGEDGRMETVDCLSEDTPGFWCVFLKRWDAIMNQTDERGISEAKERLNALAIRSTLMAEAIGSDTA